MERRVQTLPAAAPQPVLALGSDFQNAVCALEGGQARWSALHGNLREPTHRAALQASAQALLDDGLRPAALAHDLDPAIHGTRLARGLADAMRLPAVGVQHHHAHLALVGAEHGIDEPVVGWALDGAGQGTDGTTWGGELLWLDAPSRSVRWERIAHLPALALPGGAHAAAREPWRMAAAVLHALGRGDEIVPRLGPDVGIAAAATVQRMLAGGVDCPTTTAAGRWFDAAAAALGVHRGMQADAEAARALESEAAPWLAQRSAPLLERHGSLDLEPLVASLFDVPQWRRGAGAARFHVALAAALANAAAAAAEATGVGTVVLGGGCFFNRVLLQQLTQRLEAAGLRVLRPLHAGCGDAGLALGQAWVASWTLAHGAAQVPGGPAAGA